MCLGLSFWLIPFIACNHWCESWRTVWNWIFPSPGLKKAIKIVGDVKEFWTFFGRCYPVFFCGQAMVMRGGRKWPVFPVACSLPEWCQGCVGTGPVLSRTLWMVSHIDGAKDISQWGLGRNPRQASNTGSPMWHVIPNMVDGLLVSKFSNTLCGLLMALFYRLTFLVGPTLELFTCICLPVPFPLHHSISSHSHRAGT